MYDKFDAAVEELMMEENYLATLYDDNLNHYDYEDGYYGDYNDNLDGYYDDIYDGYEGPEYDYVSDLDYW